MRVFIAIGSFSICAGLAEASECVNIENDIQRLQCYDEQFAAKAPVSKQALAQNFEQLVEYRGDIEYSNFHFFDCHILHQIFTVRGKTGVDAKRGNFRQIMIDLSEVDIDSSFLARENTFISMNREASLVHSSIVLENIIYGPNPSESDTGPLSIPFSDDINPQYWYDLVTDANLIASLYPTKSNLQPGFDRYGNLSFRVNEVRSVTWQFHYFWKEDAKKIRDAFIELAKSCVKM